VLAHAPEALSVAVSGRGGPLASNIQRRPAAPGFTALAIATEFGSEQVFT
jgi:hypothetical protein